MSKREAKVAIYTCDGCQRELIADKDDIPSQGFFILHIMDFRSPTASVSAIDIFACSEKCLTKAIINALKEQNPNR